MLERRDAFLTTGLRSRGIVLSSLRDWLCRRNRRGRCRLRSPCWSLSRRPRSRRSNRPHTARSSACASSAVTVPLCRSCSHSGELLAESPPSGAGWTAHQHDTEQIACSSPRRLLVPFWSPYPQDSGRRPPVRPQATTGESAGGPEGDHGERPPDMTKPRRETYSHLGFLRRADRI